ncbi:MAG: carbamoyltransferase HypF [Planctomycetota bacterium]
MQVGHEPLIRRRLRCRGVVQGVGFRPAVLRLARAHGLAGFVRNDGEGATLEIEGTRTAVTAFVDALPHCLPSLARLAQVESEDLPPRKLAADFEIADTVFGRRGRALVPPDAALCPRCRAEIDDPRDRRHRHLFTACTECGPRYSVIRALPYDRVSTSMACFPLCPRCAAEYADPEDRRCHAEAIACPDCGPHAWLAGRDGAEIARDGEALERTRAALADGAIVALKGLGGFQLLCRPDHEAAVARLRARKARARKPFALVVRDLAVAEGLVELRDEDRALLASPQGPILLAPRRRDDRLAEVVAPGLRDLGVMLPTTPLHHALFDGAPFAALIATSGNAHDEPICIGNREALTRLSSSADLFLLHDRDIVRRVDDSVVRTHAHGTMQVRRSRGFAPTPLHLPIATDEVILALGGHLQTTACVAQGEDAFPSQHVGDLDTESARAFLREVADGLLAFLDRRPTLLVCDTHPDYPSTWLAETLAREDGRALLRVPHHLAHAAAVLAEHDAFPRNRTEHAAALILDGTGFGPDGTAWGSELLLVDGDLCFARLAHGEALPLCGGEAAVREPWRIAVAVLARAGRLDLLPHLPLSRTVDGARRAPLARLALHDAIPHAFGAGRLFEAAGALLGLASAQEYEGESAARLEAAAHDEPTLEPWPEVVASVGLFPQRSLLLHAAERAAGGETVAKVAAGLLDTFCAVTARSTAAALGGAASRVALGGGCFVNRRLAAGLTAQLGALGIETLLPRELPPGDGGLSFGQVVVAAIGRARGCTPKLVDVPVLHPRVASRPAEVRPCVSPSRCS